MCAALLLPLLLPLPAIERIFAGCHQPLLLPTPLLLPAVKHVIAGYPAGHIRPPLPLLLPPLPPLLPLLLAI